MKKRILSLVLTLLMILSIAPISAFATNEETIYESDNYGYTVSGDNATIVGTKLKDSVINIPSQLNGYTVTAIDYGAFTGNNYVTQVVIPDTVTSIGTSAFAQCQRLKTVTLGSGVETIGSWTFEDCKALTSIAIGDSVTSIGTWAFNGCTSLNTVSIGKC